MEFWRIVESEGGSALESGGAIAVVELDRMDSYRREADRGGEEVIGTAQDCFTAWKLCCVCALHRKRDALGDEADHIAFDELYNAIDRSYL